MIQSVIRSPSFPLTHPHCLYCFCHLFPSFNVFLQPAVSLSLRPFHANSDYYFRYLIIITQSSIFSSFPLSQALTHTPSSLFPYYHSHTLLFFPLLSLTHPPLYSLIITHKHSLFPYYHTHTLYSLIITHTPSFPLLSLTHPLFPYYHSHTLYSLIITHTPSLPSPHFSITSCSLTQVLPSFPRHPTLVLFLSDLHTPPALSPPSPPPAPLHAPPFTLVICPSVPVLSSWWRRTSRGRWRSYSTRSRARCSFGSW